MSAKALRLSMMKDNVTVCLPSDGYNGDKEIDIDLDDYIQVGMVNGELPKSDQTWPKGAPIDSVKVGDKIFKKK